MFRSTIIKAESVHLLQFRSFYILILCVHLYFSWQTQSSSWLSILFLFFFISWMVCTALSFLFKLVQICSVGFKSGSTLGLTWKGQVIVFFPSTLETLLWCGQCALDHYYAGISLFCRLLEIRSHCVRQYFGTFTDIHSANYKGHLPSTFCTNVSTPHQTCWIPFELNTYIVLNCPKNVLPIFIGLFWVFFSCPFFFSSKFNITVLRWRASKFFFLDAIHWA